MTQCVDLDNDVVAVRMGSCSWDTFECKDPDARGKPARKMDCNGSTRMTPSSMSYQLLVMGAAIGSTSGGGGNGTAGEVQYVQTADMRLVNYADAGSSEAGSKGNERV